MIVSLVGASCYVYREPGDPAFCPNRSRKSWSPPGWYGADSRLLYHVMQILNGRGYDLIKKRLWRDGHLYGSEHDQYLRSRNLRSVPSLYIYHGNYAIEVAAERYSVLGKVRLDVAYGVGRKGDIEFENECREWVAKREASHPCYEVSWMADAKLDGNVFTRRLFRGFRDLDDARAFLDSGPGEYCQLIDRRTGERVEAPCLA